MTASALVTRIRTPRVAWAALAALLLLLVALPEQRAWSAPASQVSVSSAVLQALTVGTADDWAERSPVFEGTRGRVVVTATATGTPVQATFRVVRADGRVLGSAGASVSGPSTVTIPVETDGAAWSSTGVAADGALSVTVALPDGTTTSAPVVGAIAPRPVVLLHGLWSDASTWSAYDGLLKSRHPSWSAYAVGDGRFPGVMDTGALLQPTRRPNTVDENAAAAWTYIEALRTGLNANEVDVVGHSMGGIITRRLLHAQGAAAQDAIRDVVMLGTPNGGSYCASVWAVPATAPLLPSVMTQFNRDNPGYPGVESTLVYTQHLAPTCTDFSWGDSVVPRWSAKAVDVDRLVVGEPTLHTNMTKDRGLFTAVVVPALARPADAPLPAGTASGDGTGTAPDEETIAQLVRTGAARAGEPLDVPVVVAAGERLTATVVTAGSADLSLVAPDGHTVRLRPSTSGLPVLTAELPVAKSRGTAHLRGTADEALDWTFTVRGGDLVMDATITSVDDRIVVQADLHADDVPVRSVTARLLDENGDDGTRLRLHDDGVKGDRAAQDDRFAGVASGRGFEPEEDVRAIVKTTFVDGRERSVIVGIDEVRR